MSLDINLTGEIEEIGCQCSNCGHEHTYKERKGSFDCNITHNLGNMAQEAGIYQHVWRPEELGITKARQLIDPLNNGLEKLRKDPVFYKKFNPENGWGDYELLVDCVAKYLKACQDFPDSDVRVSR